MHSLESRNSLSGFYSLKVATLKKECVKNQSIPRLSLQRMADLAYESVEERLAHVLLSLAQRHGKWEGKALRIDLPFSQQDLADMVGASRQAVNQELRKLVERGLIIHERCEITILDEKRLQTLR